MVSISGLIEDVKRRPIIAAGAVALGAVPIALLARGRSKSGNGTAIIAPEVTTPATTPPMENPSAPITPAFPTPGNRLPGQWTQPGFKPGEGPIRRKPPAPGKPPAAPVKTITDEQRRRFKCPPGSVLTWEKGGTGNLVCERRDGTQFQVKPGSSPKPAPKPKATGFKMPALRR